jgi:hypothetical protein
MVEFPATLLHARRIVVDDLPGAHHEAGDLIQAKVDWAQVVGIGDVLAGKIAPATLTARGAAGVQDRGPGRLGPGGRARDASNTGDLKLNVHRRKFDK